MNRFNPLGWPIRGQLAALLLLTQIGAQIITAATVDLSTSKTGGGRVALVLNLSDPMITVLRLNLSQDVVELQQRLGSLGAVDPRFRVVDHLPDTTPLSAFETEITNQIIEELPMVWQDKIRVYPLKGRPFLNAPGAEIVAVAARLGPEKWLVFEPRSDGFVQSFPRVVALLGLLIFGLPLAFLSLWAGTTLVSPIRRLAQGVDQFSADMETPPLVPSGPVEVRRLAEAFNQMRGRLKKLMADRSHALASIGHDMRTPLTRMRLRTELLPPSETTSAIERDILVLQTMIDDALEYLRADRVTLRFEEVNLAGLTGTIVEEYADQGHDMAYLGPDQLFAICDLRLMRRALDNLVGNAAKFATTTTVAVRSGAEGHVRIEIRDNGPGIPEHLREAILEPFSRIETVRLGAPQSPNGFGLGLSIAHDVIVRHGGTLVLSGNDPTGLVVTIDLPMQRETAHDKLREGAI